MAATTNTPALCQMCAACCRLRTFKGEADLKLQFFEKDNQNLKSERRRLDNKLAQIQKWVAVCVVPLGYMRMLDSICLTA